MLIEDSKMVCNRIRNLMPDYDYVVVESKADLLNKLPFLPHIDLIISDIKLEGENGIELCKFIQSLYPNIPLVFLSSMTNMMEKELREIGAYRVYDKASFAESDFMSFIPKFVKDKLKERNTNAPKMQSEARSF